MWDNLWWSSSQNRMRAENLLDWWHMPDFETVGSREVGICTREILARKISPNWDIFIRCPRALNVLKKTLNTLQPRSVLWIPYCGYKLYLNSTVKQNLRKPQSLLGDKIIFFSGNHRAIGLTQNSDKNNFAQHFVLFCKYLKKKVNRLTAAKNSILYFLWYTVYLRKIMSCKNI